MLRKSLTALLAVALMLTVCSCAGGSVRQQSSTQTANPDQTFQWKLAHEESEGEFQHYYALKFKELMEESSGGRVSIDIYPVGQLGDSTNQVELLQAGGVEFAINNPGAAAPIVPEANVFSLHFLLPPDSEKLNKIVHEGEGIKYLNDLYYAQDMHVLDWIPTGFNAWTAHKPIRTPADFAGFKMRTMAAPVISKSYEAYGAVPVAIPYTELYSALQLNMVDGQVNPLYGIAGMKFYEVQDCLTLSYPDCFFATFCANKAYWNTLPDDIRQLVTEAAAETNAYMLGMQEQIATDALDVMRDSGIEIVELTDEERAAFADIAAQNRNVYTDLVGGNGQKLLDLIIADVEKLS